MQLRLLLVALACACSAKRPAGGGYAVLDGGPCHTLLLAQCECCGSGEPFCTGQVNALVSSGKAVSNQTPQECQVTLDALKDDALCRSFDTAAELDAACQQFPPKPDAGSTAD